MRYHCSMISYKCPNCQLPLRVQERSVRCDYNHSFDIAKEGYVNLLLVQNKKSKEPGDNKAMLRSRQQFLDAGYYQNLATAISNLALKYAPEPSKIIDIGCGEGYYCERLHGAFTESNRTTEIIGVDIAKAGVQMACKRKIGMQASVASAFDLPFFNQTFDLALSVFSPICAKETERVLKPQGIVIFVGPGERHLRGLAEHIYQNPVDHTGNAHAQQELNTFELLESQTLQNTLRVEGDDIFRLLSMTPYYWQSSEDQQKAIQSLPYIETPTEFSISVYRKPG